MDIWLSANYFSVCRKKIILISPNNLFRRVNDRIQWLLAGLKTLRNSQKYYLCAKIKSAKNHGKKSEGFVLPQVRRARCTWVEVGAALFNYLFARKHGGDFLLRIGYRPESLCSWR